MKKLLTALAGFCLGTLCFAQMMPDSTVQVIAYWDKGDVMVYNCKETKSATLDGVDQGTRTGTEKHIFEVTDATENAYVLKLSFDDVMSTPVSEGATNEVAERLAENYWFETRTNELGTVQDVTNQEAAIEACRAMIPVMTDRVLSKYTPEELKEEGTSREDLIQGFTEGLCTEAFMEGLCLKDVVPMLFFHGARFKLDQQITVRQRIGGILGDYELDLDWAFWAESNECSEDYVIIRSYVEADKETLSPILRELLLDTLLENLSPDEIAEMMSEKDELNAELEEAIQAMDAKMEQYSNIVIHLGSGWPVRWWMLRETTVTEDGSTSVMTEEKEVVYDEEDYRNN